jgi:ABC-2 type transport system ATP-binding protein
MESMIETHGLRKAHGPTTVLSGVDLAVQQGEIFALLGPNGAGKTTTVNILTTLLRADSGTATVGGFDVSRQPANVRSAISLTGQNAAVDGFQTGAENLMMMCRLGHLSAASARRRTRELLERFELTDASRRMVSTYSGGMRRRLDLAISLIANPSIIFLDEPTTGLDPNSRTQMWAVVKELAEGGSTIMLTTQYLEEADQLADQVAVLDGGRIVANGTPGELKSRLDGDHVELAFADREAFDRARALLAGFSTCDDEALTLRYPTANSVATLRDLLQLSGHHGLEVANLSIIKPTLDDVFLALTGARTTTDSKVRAA